MNFLRKVFFREEFSVDWISTNLERLYVQRVCVKAVSSLGKNPILVKIKKKQIKFSYFSYIRMKFPENISSDSLS